MPEFRLLPVPKLIGSATSDPALGRTAMSACTDREARTDATVMCWLELATASAEELAHYVVFRFPSITEAARPLSPVRGRAMSR